MCADFVPQSNPFPAAIQIPVWIQNGSKGSRGVCSAVWKIPAHLTDLPLTWAIIETKKHEAHHRQIYTGLKVQSWTTLQSAPKTFPLLFSDLKHCLFFFFSPPSSLACPYLKCSPEDGKWVGGQRKEVNILGMPLLSIPQWLKIASAHKCDYKHWRSLCHYSPQTSYFETLHSSSTSLNSKKSLHLFSLRATELPELQ